MKGPAKRWATRLARLAGLGGLVSTLALAACDRATSVGAVGLRFDSAVSDGAGRGDDAGSGDASSASTPEALCLGSGGQLASQMCCLSTSAFPDTCAVGACGCSPANSTSMTVCQCARGCHLPGIGCVGAAGVCTLGDDTTCNQDPTAPSARGRCVTGNRCACLPGAALDGNGRCS